MPSPPLVDVAAVLAAGADDARVLLHAMADEAMRYLYVVSRVREGISLPLAGLLVVVAVVTTLGLARRAAPSAGAGEAKTNVEADNAATSCRARTRRGTRGAWTLRRLIVFSRPRARSGGVSI